MQHLEATSDIAASPESVWAVLSDGSHWRSMPDLHPSFTTFAHGLKQRVETGG